MYRNQTKQVSVGNVKIGGGNPVAIQSMTNTKTEDVNGTVDQILRLEAAGCEIIRCAVPTMEAAEALREIKKRIHIPLVADIHFKSVYILGGTRLEGFAACAYNRHFVIFGMYIGLHFLHLALDLNTHTLYIIIARPSTNFPPARKKFWTPRSFLRPRVRFQNAPAVIF